MAAAAVSHSSLLGGIVRVPRLPTIELSIEYDMKAQLEKQYECRLLLKHKPHGHKGKKKVDQMDKKEVELEVELELELDVKVGEKESPDVGENTIS